MCSFRVASSFSLQPRALSDAVADLILVRWLAFVHLADLSWLSGLTGAIGGLISGTVASLVAPWSQWGVEKRRLRRAPSLFS
jgi:hypothetical protein